MRKKLPLAMGTHVVTKIVRYSKGANRQPNSGLKIPIAASMALKLGWEQHDVVVLLEHEGTLIIRRLDVRPDSDAIASAVEFLQSLTKVSRKPLPGPAVPASLAQGTLPVSA
jgi:hypothetical protein